MSVGGNVAMLQRDFGGWLLGICSGWGAMCMPGRGPIRNTFNACIQLKIVCKYIYYVVYVVYVECGILGPLLRGEL